MFNLKIAFLEECRLIIYRKRGVIDIINGEKGQTLIEVIAALVIAIVVVSLIVGTVIFALDATRFGKNQNLATQYASEAMELARRERDTNFAAFKQRSGTYCLQKGSIQLLRETCGQNFYIDSIFKREVTITHDTSDCQSTVGSSTKQGTKVLVRVSWNSGKCTQQDSLCHKVELVSCLSDLSVSTP